MSADNFVGVRPNEDGTYSIFEYGCASVDGEDCMYLAGEMGIVVPNRETALVRAHDIVNDMYVCEYGVVEMSRVPDEPCGRCYVCINERHIVHDDVQRCDKCHLPIAQGEWMTLNQEGTFHSRCERQALLS